MSVTTKSTLETISKILLRCWIVGFAVLFIWFGATLSMSNIIHQAHGSMFDLSNHELDLIMYCGMGLWKLFVIVFYFLPWLSIRMMLKKES